ncbi:hypothetical protein CMI47_16570 [Candidatus Pacearchaeota archaeon]|jgi:hypothetical protein|nr:hypothetical protein [Candidatus Pacearchaeota archaeon]|tara:strand:- start:3394 stop:4113 length:720 start_codon:yes stop_codon:yes gene_type:complete
MATKKKAVSTTTHDNMKLWNSVCTTDPQYTKRVNQRGGFTAIGAQSQIMEATKVFGPFGTGFGVHTETFTSFDLEGLCLYQATLWYKSRIIRGEIKEFPIHSSIKYSYNGRIDDDFAKKVATDALTKGLSKLGFNADVFLGLFDDNKYVNQLKSKPKANGNGSMSIAIDDNMKAKIIAELNKCSDTSFITKVNTAIDKNTINVNNFKESLAKVVNHVKADNAANIIKAVDKKYGETTNE